MIVIKPVQIIKHCFGVHIWQQSPQKWKPTVGWSVKYNNSIATVKGDDWKGL